ncbi:MAG TPA: adenylate/guanylate cyclase domain-containing protein [Actinomycetota bacterium]
MRRAIRAFIEQAPELRPWSLTFRDPWLEQRFQDTYFDANLQYIRIAAILGAITWAAFGPLAQLVVTNDAIVWDSIIRYGLGVPSALISFALSYHARYRRFWQPLFAGAILFSGAVWVAHRALVDDARADWGYAGNMLIMIFAYLLSRLHFRYSAPVGLGLFAMHNVGTVFFTDESTLDLIFGDYFLLVTAFIGTIGAYFLERSQRLLFLRERELDRERGRSEGLLRNVLPEQIAVRLKERDPATDHGHIAQAYDDVTVVFADLVGFTRQSGATDPPDIVAALDEVFRRFDAVADRYGLETIKTIGDAYMAVAGAPESRPDDLESAAQAAIAMRDEVRELRWPSGDPMHVRIGMATGPAVAGVIGRRKFAYDLWGDTVNTAARLESNGIPDEIQVSDAVYRRLQERYRFSDVHIVNLKGMGPTPARFLLGRNGRP